METEYLFIYYTVTTGTEARTEVK